VQLPKIKNRIKERKSILKSNQLIYTMKRLQTVFKLISRRSLSISSKSTLDLAEVSKFSALSKQWWHDTGGPFSGLHRLNEVRVPLISEAALKNSTRSVSTETSSPRQALSGVTICDVGSGGGILSEALARRGATVTGIDASSENVAAATFHANLDLSAFRGGISYRCTTAELLASENVLFDTVVCSEVIEHVADVDELVRALSMLVKPGGSVIVTTLNRTVPSFFLAIVAGEYILKAVPVGTHEWAKFVPPEQLISAFKSNGLIEEKLVGLVYNPFKQEWTVAENNTSVNYAHVFRKAPLA
jgi:2-polyprenyl-6-hydroxyphenyl methylase / 3-demethylubiquinone-9 3-methyltransferase